MEEESEDENAEIHIDEDEIPILVQEDEDDEDDDNDNDDEENEEDAQGEWTIQSICIAASLNHDHQICQPLFGLYSNCSLPKEMYRIKAIF